MGAVSQAFEPSLNAAQILLKEQAVAQACWQQEVISVYNNYCQHDVLNTL